MKAVVFHKPYELAVEEVPDPTVEAPTDAVIRITTANICGSDLHPYEGRAPLDEGMVLGHENMGMHIGVVGVYVPQDPDEATFARGRRRAKLPSTKGWPLTRASASPPASAR